MIDCLRVAFTYKSGDDQMLPIVMLKPTMPLMDGNLICHHQNILIHFLLGLIPSLSCAQVYLINTHIGEGPMELFQYREEKERLCAQADTKGVLKFFGNNLTYFLCLYQVEEH